eukprot:363671-Chlamydomonas_euryale.AAC.9
MPAQPGASGGNVTNVTIPGLAAFGTRGRLQPPTDDAVMHGAMLTDDLVMHGACGVWTAVSVDDCTP